METKDRILKVTEKMFLKSGYKNLRTDDIAREVGISKRTLYENFSSKEELIKELIIVRYQAFNENIFSMIQEIENSSGTRYLEILKKMSSDVAEFFTFFNGDLIDDIQKHLPSIEEQCLELQEKKMQALRTMFEQGLKHGKIKPGVEFDIFFMIMRNSIYNILRPEVLKDLSLSTSEVVAQIHFIVMNGILTEEASREIIKIESN